VRLPLLLLLFSTLFATIVAYGTHPTFAQFPGGLNLILFSRQFQWPLIALSILLCILVIALIVAGKRRAWWLIGLAPIMALFFHRFYSDPLRIYSIADNQLTIAASEATFLNDDDWVVGLNFNGTDFAYPYFALYRQPVVVQSDHDKRMILMWSAFANRAVASSVSRNLAARDLEIVSMPSNALLLYNRKLGQFINGLTGLTPSGGKPSEFATPIVTQKRQWRYWKADHPQTRVMLPTSAAELDRTPASPLRPWFPQGKTPPPMPETRITLIPTTQPIAFTEQITTTPLNITADTPVLVYRPAATAPARAYDRRVKDLVLKFRPNTDRRRARAIFVDVDTNSGWTIDGRAVDGPLANQYLKSLPLEEDLYWGVMRRWYPNLTLAPETK
jgi:hypothetical protein